MQLEKYFTSKENLELAERIERKIKLNFSRVCQEVLI